MFTESTFFNKVHYISVIMHVYTLSLGVIAAGLDCIFQCLLWMICELLVRDALIRS